MEIDEPHEERNGETQQHQQEVEPVSRLTKSEAFNLYISHALSTWNARGYEFAAILFTAAAYPNTLLAAALGIFVVSSAMIVLSSQVGAWVDHSPNRLRTLSTTILVNRGCVVAATPVWLVMLSQADLIGSGSTFVLPKDEALKALLFAAATGLGIVERLSASGNLLSMERDWVVAVAAPAGQRYDLTHLNAIMRRIDLVCKLVSPLVIAAVISASGSARIGVVFTGLTSLICLPVELLCARRVWHKSPALQQQQPQQQQQQHAGSSDSSNSGLSWMAATTAALFDFFLQFRAYFAEPVWPASLALCMLHYSLLTWRPTLITFLLSSGYSLDLITIARTFGCIFEVSSTVLTPVGVRYAGKALHHVDDESFDEASAALLRTSTEEGGVEGEWEGEGSRDNNDYEAVRESGLDAQTMIGLQRFGLWGLALQVLSLAPVILILFDLTISEDGEPSISFSSAGVTTSEIANSNTALAVARRPDWSLSLMLFSFLSVSRLGLWAFDLTTQQLTQTLVDPSRRSAFAGVENSFVYVFELLGAASAIAFPHPVHFKWLALASWAFIVGSLVLYAVWVRARRGHLFHWDQAARGFCIGQGKW